VIRFGLALFVATLFAPSAAAGKDNKLIEPAAVAKIRVELVSEADRFEGYTRWTSKKTRDLGGSGFLDTISVNPVYFKRESGDEGFYLHSRYSGFGWLFLTGSVIVLLDGKTRIDLTGPDSSAQRKVESCTGGGGCLVTEVLRTPITREQLLAISSAHSVEVRFNGASKYMDCYFKPFHVAAVKAVLAVATPSAP
jgi:hypothetical protein